MAGGKTARERMVESAALLMAEHGVEGTSFSQVVRHSGAPRGSIYHYFPGGKAQLIEEATRWVGDFLAGGVAADPLAGLDALEGFWRSFLESSDFARGCPVVAATVAGHRTPEARTAAKEVFARWQGLTADGLRRHGVSDDKARSVAALCLAATEGAVIMARAERSLEPFDRVFGELRQMMADALGEGAK